MADANDDEWLYGAEGDADGDKEQEKIEESAGRPDLLAKNGTTTEFDDHNLEVNMN